MIRNIKFYRLLINSLTIVISCIIISIMLYFIASKAIINYVKSSLTEIAKQGAEIANKEIEKKFSILETLAKIDTIHITNIPIEQKLQMLNTHFKIDDLSRISIADKQGNSYTTDAHTLYVGDREYFQKAISGYRAVTDPIISRIDGKMVVVFAVPVFYNNAVVYVLYATYPVEVLSLITDNIKMGEDGNSFILNKEGITIAHNNRDLVYNANNDFENVKKDPSLKFLVELEKQMIYGQSGAGEYIYNGVRKYMGFAPIKGTQWSFATAAPKKTVFKNINQILFFALVSIIIVAVILLIMNFYLRYLRIRLNDQKVISQNAIDTAKMMIILLSPDGQIIGFNKNTEEKTGYKNEEVIGKKTIYDLVDKEQLQYVEQLLHNINRGRFERDIEFSLVNSQGQKIFGVWNVNISDFTRVKNNIEIMGIDISERVSAENELLTKHEELTAIYEELAASEEELKTQYEVLSKHEEEMRKSKERYELIIEASPIGIWDIDMVTKEKFYSSKWYEMLGFTGSEPEEEKNEWHQLIHPDDVDKGNKVINGHLSQRTDYYEYEYRVKTKEGKEKWILAVGKALWNDNGNPYRMAGAYLDITEKKEYEEKIKKYAYFDSLTGLPNRISLIRQFKSIIKKELKAALLFMDIDNFKLINDTYGHNLGDLLLVQVGNRINEIGGYHYFASRLGGDEYAILLMDIDTQEQIVHFCNSLLYSLNQSYSINDIYLNISLSIGIALYPEDGDSFSELLKHADTAMYKAKESGKNRYAFFTKQMNEITVEKMTIQNYLRNALENNEFELYYQPQYDINNRKITGFEALVRWNNPTLGLVSPVKFINIAEETQIIIPLGKWVLKTACQFIKRINDETARQYIISVNISILQLMQDNFVDMVLEILKEEELDPSLLELELTESILMQSFGIVADKLERLRKDGVKVALDDFGKGYSSLSYLKQLPITTLKIDKSFIDNIENLGKVDNLTGSIVYMGKKLGLTIVAEGVETKQQLKYLIKYKCNKIQGYLFSKPVPEKEVYSLIYNDDVIDM